jgi:uncharacterized SAM-binding protein YcdF (DUF218 family)
MARMMPRRADPLRHNRDPSRPPDPTAKPAPPVNDLLVLLAAESWKPVLTALLLPPVPFLVLMLIGARLIMARRGLGWTLVLLGTALIWLGSCTGSARLLAQVALHAPPALTAERLRALRAPTGATAIVVLGGGMEPLAPEYGAASLQYPSLERLRYGIWLSRETGLPLAFSGGVGWGQHGATPEARIAARIAANEFGRPLKWVEDQSRDTRENAARSVALLRAAGVRQIVLVTHGWHMPRALRAFEAAAGADIRIEAAPMGLARGTETPALTWMPTTKGITDVRNVVRELLGRIAGA